MILHTQEKNFLLNCTNPRITGNYKIVIDSKNTWFLESINSSEVLANSKLKGFVINKSYSFETNLRNYTSSLSAFSHFYDIIDTKQLVYSTDLYQQYHQMYETGAYSEASKTINGNFRYFAPLQIQDIKNLPTHFIIVKTNATKNDFQSICNSSYKVVEMYDLKELNDWYLSKIENSYISTDLTNLYISGLHVQTGRQTIIHEDSMKSLRMNEQTITENNNWITNAYKRNNLIYTNIVNVEFAFTDKEVNNNFVRYAGFYVTLHDIDVDDAIHTNNALLLTKLQNSVIAFDENVILKTYDKKEHSIKCQNFGKLLQNTITFDFTVPPEPNTKLKIAVNRIVDFEITLDANVVNKSLRQIKQFIIDKINNEFSGTASTLHATLQIDGIRLVTNNIIDAATTLSLESTSRIIQVQKSIYGDNTNLFSHPSINTFTSKELVDTTKFAHIQIHNTTYKIVKIEKYFDLYLYTVDRALESNLKADTIVYVVTVHTEKHKIAHPLSIAELCMHSEIEQIENDFDKNLYKAYILNETVSPTLLNIANSYFDEIIDDKISFIKDIDVVETLSTTVDEPYSRFSESTLPQLLKFNKLNQFINHWVSNENSVNIDNELNVSLAYRLNSLNSSHFANSKRNLIEQTHDWFILISGQPPYLRKFSKSYSTISLNVDTFSSKTTNAYDYLLMHSKISYDKKQNKSFVYFKGVKYAINRNLHNYRFAVVLDPTKPVENSNFDIHYIQNDKFKTFTIYVNFYIPEPVLTKLERSDRYYFADKSLMYYSTKLYATKNNTVNLGRSRISLNIYDELEDKTYLGSNVGKNWLYNSPQGLIACVKRGNSTIFDTSFIDILQIGGSLSIFYTLSRDWQFSPLFGMEITFEDIVAIDDDYFWCRKIYVYANKTQDILNDDYRGFDNIDDNVVTNFYRFDIIDMYTRNPEVFRNNNFAYISKAIAYELCSYDKRSSIAANIARYKDISLSSISKHFVNKNVSSFDENHPNEVDIDVIDMMYANIVISKKEQNNQLETTKSYTYTIGRQNLEYKPRIREILKFAGPFANTIVDYSKWKKQLTKNHIPEQLTYAKYRQDLSLSTMYSSVTNSDNNIENIHWLCGPNEFRTPISSIVFNSSEYVTIRFNYNAENTTLYTILRQYLLSIIPEEISIADLIKFINIKENCTEETLHNYDPYRLIYENFILNVFMNIYTVETIRSNNHDEEFIINGLNVHINNANDNEQYTIIFKR